MEVVAISDLHGFLEKPDKMPNGDIFCICGDIVPLEYQNSYEASIAWFCLEFVPWTDLLPYNKVLFIGGNHDFFLEKLHHKNEEYVWDEKHQIWTKQWCWRSPSAVLKQLLPGNNKSKHKLVYLCDNSVEIEGKRFYGTPWISNLERWAFYLPNDQLKARYNNIPKQFDVLMTHMPPKLSGVGQVQQRSSFNAYVDFGSQALADVIISRDIKWSISGHIHSGVHQPQSIAENKFVANVSVKDEDYAVRYFPLKFTI